MLVRPFSLDVVPGGVPLQVHVSQYDSDQQLELSLYSSQGTLTIPRTRVAAAIRGTKLDGNGISNSCALTYENDVPVVTVQLTQQMTAIAGKNPFEIVITATDISGDSYELPSATFYLMVKRAAMDYDTVDSDSDIMEIIDVMSKADQLIAAAETIEDAAEEIKKGGYVGKEELEALQEEVAQIENTVSGMQTALANKVQGGYVADNSLYLVTDDSGSLGPFSGMGGGGGGGSTDSVMTMSNITGWTSTTISEGGSCVLQVSWSSLEDNMPTGDGTMTVYVNETAKAAINVAQGNVSVNVGPYLAVGSNTVRLTIMDSTGNSKSRTFTVTVISLYITSSFDDTVIQSGSFVFNDVGSQTITFRTGAVTKTYTITVTALDIDVHAETDSLLLYLSSASRSNNEANPATWTYGNISCAFSGFNWRSNGWVEDSDGIVALRLSGDARVTIPYKLFENDFRATGQTIEIDFATRDVMDYDAPVISCMYGGRGLTVTPQSCRIASEQSAFSMQYKEDEHVRISFVIEKSSGLRRMYSYVDGIVSGCIQYAADDDFSQTSPVYISVGSGLATLDLYCDRVYENDLTSEQIKDNWIADTQDGALLVERYQRNNIYDAYGSIVLSQIPRDLPYMIIECPELPQYKGDKKKVTGRYVDPSDASRSFTFVGCEANVQGIKVIRQKYDFLSHGPAHRIPPFLILSMKIPCQLSPAGFCVSEIFAATRIFSRALVIWI